MMKRIFGAMVIIAVVTAFFTNKMSLVSNSILNEGVNAVELSLYLLGGMCVWGGVMRVAEKARLTDKLCLIFKPAARLLFKGLSTESRAFRAICMNITANLLGLGNAATPLGIEAMKELEAQNDCPGTASDNMIVFTVLNTASITLIPTTVASLRHKHGSMEPLDVLGGILISTAISLAVSLTLALTLNRIRRRK